MTRRYLRASGKAWWQAREKALERDGYQCQAHTLNLCNDPCDAPARKLTVHHKKWRVHGGAHDLENLVTLCYQHHMMFHPFMMDKAGKDGYFKELGEYEKPELGDDWSIEL